MAKVKKKKKSCKKRSALVGLSNAPNLTAKNTAYVSCQYFFSGEAKLQVRFKPGSVQSGTKPPVNCGVRKNSDGLTNYAQSKIKRSARCFQRLVEDDKGVPGYASFITLSYRNEWPSDKQAKRDLDNWFKRIRRRQEFTYYVWVAERQERGAIHFHILTPHYIDKERINEQWNEVVNGRKRRQNKKVEELYPHVQGVYNAGAYMTKYLTKEAENIKGSLWDMSRATHTLCKPEAIVETEVPYSYLREAMQEMKERTEKVGFVVEWESWDTYGGIWTPKGEELAKNVQDLGVEIWGEIRENYW